jgi:hypothetical protein
LGVVVGWNGAILCLPVLFRLEVVDPAFICMVQTAVVFYFMLLQKTFGYDEEVQAVVHKWLHMQAFFFTSALGISEALKEVHPKQWGLC